MNRHKSHFLKTLFAASVPLIAGGAFYLLEGTISGLKSFFENQDSALNNMDELQPQSLEEIFGKLSALSLSAYTSEFHFLIAMFIINLIWKVLTGRIISQSDTKMSKKDIEGNKNSDKTSLGMKQLEIKKFVVSILFYSMAFLLIQVIGFLVFTNIGFTFTSLSIQKGELLISQLPGRILSQENKTTSDLVVSEKISFSIARTLTSLDLPLSSIVLSKDNTLAFVMVQTFGALKIIDISDPQYPVVKASLDLARPVSFYGQKSLLLSRDEKTLFVSNFKFLEIIDVSDKLLPKLLGTYNEKDLPDKVILSTSQSHRQEPLTTLALSKDKKTLFVGGLGLMIFDVSDLSNAKILFKQINTAPQIELVTQSSVALSADGKKLFYANGILHVLEVSDPKSPKQATYWKREGFFVSSVFLADDNKTAYVAGNYKEAESFVEQVDISNIQTPAVIKKTTLSLKDAYLPFIIGASPRKTQLYVAVYNTDHALHTGQSIFVFDVPQNAVVSDNQSMIKYAYSIVISADSKKAFAATSSQFVVFELFTSYPNSQVLSLSKNQIGYFRTEVFWSNFVLSADGATAYVEAMHPVTYSFWLEIWNVTNRYAPSLINSYKDLANFDTMAISPDFKRAFFFSQTQVFALDISDVNNLKLAANYQYLNGHVPRVIKIQASQDANILFVLVNGWISILDFSDLNQVKEISRIESSRINVYSKFDLSRDEKTLYLVQSTSQVYDLTDKAKPRMTSSFSVLKNEPEIYTYSVKLSPDSKTLFTELFEANRIKKLRIFNISNPSEITALSETLLPMFEISSSIIPFEMAPDWKTGYVFQKDKMLMFNLTDLAAPAISGVLPILNGTTDTGRVNNFVLGSDGKTAFVYLKSEMIILDLQLRHTLFLNQENFLLGKKYSDGVMLFKIDEKERHTSLSRDSFKFLTSYLLDFKIVINKASSDMKFSALPSWITFDSNNQALTVDAKREADLGNYTLYTTCSKKIFFGDFSRLDFVKDNKTIWRDLITTLQSLNYVDNENFLTSRFGNSETFMLTAQFAEYQGVIYNFLRGYFIETATRFEVKSSARLLEDGGKFVVVTPSAAEVRVEIVLHPRQKELETEGQFLLRPYAFLIPVITEKKSRIRLEGSLKEVNQALQEIVVNYERESWCSGEITIVDNMNPPITRAIGNISQYFQRNERPKCNPEVTHSVQKQVEISPIYTGQYFTINLNKSTFKDEYIEELSYNLRMAKEPRELPDWMIFEDLVIKGTPPEQIFGRDIELVLQVKNEFKTLEVPLRLHVKISSIFVLKLIMKYAPYILTALGLLISANKMYNILAKKYYKHRKEFFIEVGEEVSPQVIYPIRFYGDEKRESKLMLKRMLMGKGRTELLNKVMVEEGRQLDKQKIVEMAKKVFLEMSKSDQKELRLYRQAARATLINRIIINELVKWQIDLKEEKETKEIFEKIKNKWVDLVDWDLENSEFVINARKFKKLMLNSYEDSGKTMDDSQESLIGRNSDFDMNLLKDAVLAYAFEDHNIEESSILVEVVVKQKMEKNILFKCLKLDLREIHLNEKSRLDYGINYNIKRDTLNFYGIPDEGIEGKTLVVQITSTKRRILKEIWIHGISKNSGDSEDVMNESREISLPL